MAIGELLHTVAQRQDVDKSFPTGNSANFCCHNRFLKPNCGPSSCRSDAELAVGEGCGQIAGLFWYVFESAFTLAVTSVRHRQISLDGR